MKKWKEAKSIEIGKKERKLSLITADIIAYVDNPKECTLGLSNAVYLEHCTSTILQFKKISKKRYVMFIYACQASSTAWHTTGVL